MTRIALALLLVVGMGVGSASAAPPVSVGVEIGAVSRDIEEEGGLVLGTARGVADSTRLTARLAVAVAPGVAIFGEVGGADLSVDEFDGYRSDIHASYGAGIRLSSAQLGDPRHPVVFADVRVTRLSTTDQMVADWCLDAGCTTFGPRLLEESLAWTEYVVGIGLQGRLPGLHPFGGIQFSKLDGTDEIRPDDGGVVVTSRSEVREADSVGFFLGADLPLDRAERSSISFRISGIDENGFRLGYKLVF